MSNNQLKLDKNLTLNKLVHMHPDMQALDTLFFLAGQAPFK